MNKRHLRNSASAMLAVEKRTAPPPKGIALAAVILLLLVMTLLGTVGLRMAGQQETMTGNLKHLTRAQFAAEQAVREAIDLKIYTLDSDPTDVDWRYVGTGTGTDYSYTFVIKHKQAFGAVVTDEEGFPYYVINTEGVSGKARRQVEVAVVNLYSAQSIYDTGFIGCKGVPFDSKATILSYRSDGEVTDGNNGNIKTVELPGDINLNSDTDVKGNAKAVGEINMDSKARIRGDAYANERIRTQSDARIYGNAFSGSTISGNISGQENENQELPVVETESCDPLGIAAKIAEFGAPTSLRPNAGDNDNAPNLSTSYNESNTDKTFGSGDYYFSKLSLKDGTFNLSGTITIFVDGEFYLGGSQKFNIAADANVKVYVTGKFFMDSDAKLTIANNAHGVPDASRFQLFSSAVNANANDKAQAKVRIDSNSTFTGIIYAPYAHVSYDSNATSHGAVRGRWAEMNSNGAFLYDETLSELTEGSAPIDLGYKIVYWTESAYDSYSTLDTSVPPPTVATTLPPGGGTGATTTSTTTSTSISSPTTTGTPTPPTTAPPPFQPSFNVGNISCNSGDKRFKITLENTANQSCLINNIIFTRWPSGNGNYEKLEIGGDQVDEGNEGSQAYTIRKWKSGSSGKRTLDYNDSRQLDFLFKDDAKKGLYTLTFDFNCDRSNVTKLDVSHECN